MQPPFPFSRTSYPVPPATRRPRAAASNSNLKGGAGSPGPSISRLLAAAAAVTASRSWVLHDGDSTGGVGLIVLALFGGRIWREVMKRRGDKKGKRKEVGGVEVLSLEQVGSALALVAQAIAFFMAIKSIGPLRIIGPMWKDDPGITRRPFPFVPAILACAFVLFDAHKLHGPECLINLFTLIALTLILCGPWASALELRSRNARPGGGGRLGRLALTFGVAVVSILGLAYLDVIPYPHTMLHFPLHHLGLPLATAALAAYAPVPFAPSYDPKPAARLRNPRDYVVYLLAIVVLQFFALHPLPTTIDVLVLLPLVLSTIYLKPYPEAYTPKATGIKDWKYTPAPMVSTNSKWSYWNLIPQAWKPHFQTILHTDSSRKILYFLLINLGYMGVQMGYGVMTNSLGLISDAIHMFFDCLGIGIGLWASVAATWKPDGRYTFGYSRVETLSGFTNGLFLILISVFIIFEAIQRIMDPPEMEMRQLLLVSSIGLGINLFGMWATGGHHHHGHSHGGHGHDHGHSHGHVHHKKEDHMHADDHQHHDHSHDDHDHGHSHGATPLNSLGHARRRSSGKGSNDLTLSSQHHHEHDHHRADACDGHDHSTHDHAMTPDHSHSHDHTDCLHDHGHQEQHNHSAHGHDHTHDHPHDHKHDNHVHDHSHDHGHSHSHHGHAHSHNMRGVFLHVMADTLGSVGVIISTLMIKYTGWTVFDPIASLFIAALIMASVIPLVIDSGRVLCLDVGADCDKEIQAALADLATVEGLANFSAPRFWPRCEGELIGSIHIQLALSRSAHDPSRYSSPALHKGPAIYANADKVVARVEKVLRKGIPGLVEMVVQVEGSEERVFCDCMTGG